MELVYLILFFITLIFNYIDGAIMKEMTLKVFQTEVIYSSDDEGSLLQCAHKCRRIDKKSVVDFKESKCSCFRYKTKEQNNELTLSGIFVEQKMMKYVKPVEKVLNDALSKPVTEKETDRGKPEYGNDGLMDTQTLTPYIPNPFWRVDLLEIKHIRYMIIYGGDHLPGIKGARSKASVNSGLVVYTQIKDRTEGTYCFGLGDLGDEQIVNFTCNQPANARYVIVTSSETCRLSIREFEVYSTTNVDIKKESKWT